jgi:prevent-host-death family protein
VKSVDYAQAREHLDEILNEAQRQPIVIRRQGKEIAILLSMAEYERLHGGAVREFLDLRNDIAREARTAGLTEDRLSELLNND